VKDVNGVTDVVLFQFVDSFTLSHHFVAHFHVDTLTERQKHPMFSHENVIVEFDPSPIAQRRSSSRPQPRSGFKHGEAYSAEQGPTKKYPNTQGNVEQQGDILWPFLGAALWRVVRVTSRERDRIGLL